MPTIHGCRLVPDDFFRPLREKKERGQAKGLYPFRRSVVEADGEKIGDYARFRRAAITKPRTEHNPTSVNGSPLGSGVAMLIAPKSP